MKNKLNWFLFQIKEINKYYTHFKVINWNYTLKRAFFFQPPPPVVTFTPNFAFLVGFFRGFKSVHDGFGCLCHCRWFLWQIWWWCSCLIKIRHRVGFGSESYAFGFVMCCIVRMCFQVLSKWRWFHFIVHMVLCVVASSRLCLVLLVSIACYCPCFLWLYHKFIKFSRFPRIRFYIGVVWIFILVLVTDFGLFYYPSHSLWLTLYFLGSKESGFLACKPLISAYYD